MSYALESLHKIRVMREDRAGTELTGARQARSAAERAHDEKEKACQEFEAHKDERRDRIYEAVMGRVVSMDDLDRARSAVTKIDEEGVLLAEAERQAKVAFEKKSEEAEVARVRFVAATKNKTKIDLHRAAWEEEDRRMREMQADAEMEEFTGRKLTSDDDDTFD